MSDPNRLYVSARRTLLDVLDALAPHNDAIVVVGAHAVYLRTGDAGIRVAPFTTDADVMLNPALLAERPQLELALDRGGFKPRPNQPGVWSTRPAEDPEAIPVDIMVPASVAPGAGRRSVSLPGHDRMVARRAVGLEAALIDSATMSIEALDASDPRVAVTRVAGPTALLVAKLHKLHDRADVKQERVHAKDAGDVYRLIQATDVSVVVAVLTTLLEDDAAGAVTREAVDHLRALFGAKALPGVRLAVAALSPAVPVLRIESVIAAFVHHVLREVGG